MKTKAGLLSTGLNLLLSLLKFLVYAMTGSLAILAEAWHSVSDVGTSLLVLLSVTRPSSIGATRPEGAASRAPDSEPAPEGAGGEPGALEAFLRRTSLEHYVASGIGILLVVVALGVMRKVAVLPKTGIERPMLSGIIFFIFAVGSYFVYRFETSVGAREGSVGLISDGMHSKADMIGAVMTGAALILYSLGIDVDRPVAVLISLFVLSFGVETLVATITARVRGDMSAVDHMHVARAVFSSLRREKVVQAARWLESALGWRIVDRLHSGHRLARALRYPAVAVAFLLYLSTSLYAVGPSEAAILTRFGRPLREGRPVYSGLHLKLPWPIDRPIRTDPYLVRQVNLGNVTDPGAFALLWTRAHGTEQPFLSGDNSFFFPYVVLHYRIADVYQYLTAHTDPEGLLDSVAHSVVSRTLAGLRFDDIVGTGRGRLESRIRELVQAESDSLRGGMEILGVHFRDIHPPIFIADAFEQVIAARQEKEQLINEAHGYRNQAIPQRRGDAVRTVEQANSYLDQRVAHAEGDAARFVARLMQEPVARRVTLTRLYLDELIEILKVSTVTLVDPKTRTPTLFLDMPALPAPEALRWEARE